MGKWHLERLAWAVSAIALCALGGCGGSKPPGPSLVPGKILVTPATSISLQLGSTLLFTATAQNGGGTAVTPAFTFQSSNSSILDITPSGAACAGRWDPTFNFCTPGNSGTVQVTATALGVTSSPTLVFVHPPIDNITVTEVLNTTPPPPAGPCFPQSRIITLQATAWSQNTDVTSTVGPFTWSASNISVVTLTPIVNSTLNIATNQVTATATTPGLTQIYASASGVSSSAFRQATPDPSLVWDFFETCPIQSISLQLTPNGVQTGQTTFTTNKGTGQTTTATVTDVLGNSSLLNNTGAPVLTKIPLTWSASQPGSVASAACTELTCAVTTPGPGAGSVTASCTPPTCNVGFPQIPPGLSSTSTCAHFLNLPSCQPFIPVPVYATTAISGEVAGAPTSTSVLATSVDCATNATNNLCTTDIYNVSTSTNLPGNPVPLPVPPSSLTFDLAGDKAYMGSQFGAQLITVANLGSSTNPFAPQGTATGNVLAVSPDGNAAIFSDTVHTPNQVYVANSAVAGAPTLVALNITGATAAAFSPDNLNGYIIANSGNSVYVYSTLQALQNLSNPPVGLPSGTGSANLIAFSPNEAFVYIAGSPSSVTGPALTTLNVCNDQIATHTDPSTFVVTEQIIPLGAAPLFLTTIPNSHMDGAGVQTFPPTTPPPVPIPDGMHLIALDGTGIDVITATNMATTISPTNKPPQGSCPQDVTHTVQRIQLGQGTFNPVAFFVSPDATQAFIVASDRSSILVYNFSTGVVSGIELAGNATPVVPLNPLQPVAGMSTDGTLIYVAGSDGLLHQISTTSVIDLAQISFPNLPSLANPFCSLSATSGQSCKLDFVAVKP